MTKRRRSLSEEDLRAPGEGEEGADDAAEPGAHRPTRSEKRRVAVEAEGVGKALVELPAAKLEKIALPEEIADAVEEARRLRSHGAKKRQLQYLAKLLRGADETDAIREALERLSDLDRKGTAEFQRLERWRERLLEEGDPALDELCARYPKADRQRLAALVEQARGEAARGRPPAAFRALFRELRGLAAGG